MQVASFKKQKDKNLSLNSDFTTQVTSKKHSRKSSFYIKLSKNCQQKKILDNPSLILPQPKQKKKFMNITVKKENNGPLTDRTNRQQNLATKKQIINFNFCQEVPSNENFYTQNFKDFQNTGKQNNQRKQLNLGHHRRASVNSERLFYNLESPIFKLIQLQNAMEEEIKQQKQHQIKPFES